jgi:hypothetical protein
VYVFSINRIFTLEYNDTHRMSVQITRSGRRITAPIRYTPSDDGSVASDFSLRDLDELDSEDEREAAALQAEEEEELRRAGFDPNEMSGEETDASWQGSDTEECDSEDSGEGDESSECSGSEDLEELIEAGATILQEETRREQRQLLREQYPLLWGMVNSHVLDLIEMREMVEDEDELPPLLPPDLEPNQTPFQRALGYFTILQNDPDSEAALENAALAVMAL